MTIDCFTMGTAHLVGNALASQFRLRHRIFVDRTHYGVPTFKGMEYDQFDTPAATYFVWRDESGEARGVARLSPTDRPYMLAEVWPDMVKSIELPHSRTVWEGTRFGVDKDLPVELRRRIVAELVLGYIEYGVHNNIDAIIGVMPTLIWRAVFSSNGWPVEFLGDTRILGIDKCVAGRLPLSHEVLQRVRSKVGITGSVLRNAEDVIERRAA